jgi:hypothetical protein
MRDCDIFLLKCRCCPGRPSRRIPRDVHEDARDVARRKMRIKVFLESRDQRKRVEMRFAHLKTAIVQNLNTLAMRLIQPPPASA